MKKQLAEEDQEENVKDQEKEEENDYAEDQLQGTNSIKKGPCTLALDALLKKLHICRQAFHGKSFIGNHVHKMLHVWSFISDSGLAYLSKDFFFEFFLPQINQYS